MKKIIPVILLFISLCLSACGEGESAVVTASVEDIYTAVAITMTAQYTPATPTETSPPSPTNTEAVTPTETPTLVATPQPVISYSSTTSSSSNACDSSEFVSDVTIPDGTVMAPGQTFKKTWLLKNNGTCNWTADYEIIFVSGDAMGGDDTPIGVAVSSGSQLKASVDLVAPDKEGTYTGYWKLVNEEENSFGISFYVQIVVSKNASTFTPTSTATGYTSTPTSTTVSVSTATNTPKTEIVPTNTPIPATATSTNTAQPTETPASTEAKVVETSETPAS